MNHATENQPRTEPPPCILYDNHTSAQGIATVNSNHQGLKTLPVIISVWNFPLQPATEQLVVSEPMLVSIMLQAPDPFHPIVHTKYQATRLIYICNIES